MWGWLGFVTNVPTSRTVYGPVGSTAPAPVPFPAGPASAAPLVLTAVAVSGGDSTRSIDPYAGRRRATIDPPVQYANARVQPFDYIGVQEAGAVSSNHHPVTSIGNPIIIVPPCNPLVSPRLAPPKLITPQLAQAGTQAEVRSAAWARGGKPRSVRQPEGVSTPSPSVVTRWSTYG